MLQIAVDKTCCKCSIQFWRSYLTPRYGYHIFSQNQLIYHTFQPILIICLPTFLQHSHHISTTLLPHLYHIHSYTKHFFFSTNLSRSIRISSKWFIFYLNLSTVFSRLLLDRPTNPCARLGARWRLLWVSEIARKTASLDFSEILLYTAAFRWRFIL